MARLRAGACRRTALSLGAVALEAASPSTSPDFSAVAYHFGRMLRDSLKVPVGIVANPVGGATTESWIDIETLKRDEPDALVKWQTNDYIQPWAQGRAKLNSPAIATPMNRLSLCLRHTPTGTAPVAGTIMVSGREQCPQYRKP